MASVKHVSRGSWLAAGATLAGIAILAATALAVHRQAQQAEALYPPTGDFITVDGVKLHYRDTGGSGPAVVLLHGNGAMMVDMEISGLVDELVQSHRVIVFDRPGYGYSERPRSRIWTPEAQADLFARAFTRLKLDRPVVFGHSWGTLVAMALGLHHANRVEGLVLASGYYFPTARADVALFAPPSIPVLGDLIRHTVGPLVGRSIAPKAIGKMFAPRSVTVEFALNFPLELALRPSQIRASSEEATLMIPAAAGLEGEYANLTVPLVIIAGEQDRIVDTARQSVALAEMIPRARLILLPGLGHMVHHDAAPEIARAIDSLSRRRARQAMKRAA